MKRLTLGSLFDGIGGFILAAQRCGIKTLWASEIEPSCISITKRHFPAVEHLGDITKIHGGEIPAVDIISFGSPCQDLSIAGRQLGLEHGKRSSLFMDAARIIFEMRESTGGTHPTFIIWENVPGAFSSNGGYDFRTVVETLTKASFPMPRSGKWAAAGMAGACAGGANIVWRVLDSQFWGIPQRRKRIFLVGDFGGKRGPEILFKRESLLGYSGKGGKARESSAAVVGGGIENPGKNNPSTHAINLQVATRHISLGEGTGLGIADEGEPAYTLQAAHGHAVFSAEETVVDFGRAGDRIRINPKTSSTLCALGGGGGAKTGLYLIPENAKRIDPLNDNSIKICYNENGYGNFAEGVGPLRAQRTDKTNRIVILDRAALFIKYILRKLTPLECERLQGFPDYWTKYTDTGVELADTPRYTALGNSLTVPCAERVFRGIIAAVDKNAFDHNGGA